MNLEEPQELFGSQRGLLKNPLECGKGKVFIVDRHGNPQLWARRVEQACVTAGLVVDIKTGALKGAHNFFWFEDWQLCHWGY